MGRDTRSDGTGDDKGRTASKSRTIVEYIVLAVVAVAVALLIQAFLVKPYRIPSASMEDTLLIGDRVLVDRITWRFSQPARGDIVVFHPPFDGPVLIKRIIGLPWALQEPFKVPAGSYFVMGDNRTDSGDSREFGPIKRAQFVGRAFARYWPPGRIGGVQ